MKKITLLLAFVVCFVFQGHAQIVIGNGTDQEQHTPWEPYYGYTYAQSIYLASEINASGNITSLQWYFSGTSTLPDNQGLVIYLGHTDKSAFSSSSDWEDVSNLTQVYAGGITVNGPGWVTITFTEPFAYNGTDNLIVAVDENMAEYDESGDDFYNFQTDEVRSIYVYSDTDNVSPSDPNVAGSTSWALQRGTANFVPNIIFGGITQACPTPFNVAASAPSIEGATVNWQTTGSATAWQVLALPAADPAPTASDAGTDVSGTPTFTITGLGDSQAYKAYVRANCGGGLFSAWSSYATFTTLCPSFGDTEENFDTTETGTVPACWSVINDAANPNWVTAAVVGYDAASQPNAFELYNSEFTTANMILVSPPLQAMAADTHRIRFKAWTGSAGSTIEVGTLTDPTDPETFVMVETFTLSGSYVTYFAEFPQAAGPFIGFRHGQEAAYQSIHIDDVFWEPKPACADILYTSMSYTGVTEAAATVNWEAGGSETAWQYVYGGADDTDPESLLPAIDVTTTPSATLNNLDPDTIYKVWVRSNCGSGNFGGWSEPITFRTTCEPSGDFTEDFDSTPYGSLPACWSKIVQSQSTSAMVQATDWNSSSGDNSAVLYNSWDTEGQILLVSPPLLDAPLGTHRLKFKAFSFFNGAELVVGTMTDPNDPDTFSPLDTVTLNDNNANWSTYSVTVTGTTDMFVAFKHGNNESYVEEYVDDVVWEPIPSEPPACVGEVTVEPHPDCGSYATAFSWDAVDGADGYLISIGTAPGLNDVLEAEDLGDATTFSWSGDADTTYYFTVLSYNALSPATGCTEASFATAAGQCLCLSMPESVDGSGIANVQIGSMDYPSSGMTYYDHSDTPATLAIGINNNVQIAFETGYTYGTRLWIDFNDDYVLSDDEIVFYGTSTDEDETVLNASFVLDGSYTPGVHKARLQSGDSSQDYDPQPCYNGTWAVTLDFVVELVVPSCTPATFESVTINPDCENGQYFVDVDITALGNGTPVINDGTETYPVTALGVVSVGPYGDGDEVTLWLEHGTDPICDMPLGTFSYSCPPANDALCQAIALEIDAESAGDAYTLAAATAEDGEPVGDCFDSGINGSVWFSFVAPASGEVRVTTDILGGSCQDTEIAVYAAADVECADPSTLGDAIGCDQDGGDEQIYNSVLDFEGGNALTPGATYYVQVDRWGTAVDGTFGIMVVDLNPLGTEHFVDSAFSFHPNPVRNELNLSYVKSISNVEIVNLLGQTVLRAEPNATSARIDMSPLAAGTYMVKVGIGNLVKVIKVIKE